MLTSTLRTRVYMKENVKRHDVPVTKRTLWVRKPDGAVEFNISISRLEDTLLLEQEIMYSKLGGSMLPPCRLVFFWEAKCTALLAKLDEKMYIFLRVYFCKLTKMERDPNWFWGYELAKFNAEEYFCGYQMLRLLLRASWDILCSKSHIAQRDIGSLEKHDEW